MKKQLALLVLLALAACARNPDPEYAADSPAAPVAPVAPAAAEPAAAVPAAAPRLSDQEALRLGREATALLFAEDIATLFERFDANIKAQVGSADAFATMVGQVFAQTGVEGSLVEEAIDSDPGHPGLAIYRRRSSYLAIGQELDLLVALNADGSIAGVNIRPVQ